MNRLSLTFPAIALIMIIGCSSHGTSPVTPDEQPSNSFTNGNINAGISEYLPDGRPAGGVSVLGLYNVHVDTKNLTGEIVPARNGSLEDVLEVVDISGFMSVAPCTDCVKLQSISLNSDGNIVLSIGLKHPFMPGNPAMPITGKNRADLHVFNIEGVIVSDGGTTPIVFSSIGETIGNFFLTNADGYSPYLDDMLDGILNTTATIHPYILHFDDYSSGNFSASNPNGFQSVTTPGPNGCLVMAMGCDYDFKNYIFQSTAGADMDFIYAVECTYAVSAATKNDRFNPEFRIPQHNKKAASEVKIEIAENGLIAGLDTSTATFHIKVLDYNHGVAVGTDLDEMLADSSVGSISIEIPQVTLTPVIVNSPVEISGTGNDPADPLTYEITVTNTGAADEGFYTGLIKVLDSYSSGLNTNALLDGMDGIERVGPTDSPLDGLFDISEFAAYQSFEIEVISTIPNCVIVTDPDPVDIIQGDPIQFDGSGSSATGSSTIISYEWDYDYDGITFDIDDTGDIVNPSLCESGTRDVALRVTDNLTESSICTVPITITDTYPTTGWGTDTPISSSLLGFVLNTGQRAIRIYGDDLYVTFYTVTTPRNIYFVRSEDMGATWENPVQVTTYTAPNLERTEGCNLWVDGNTSDIYIAYKSQASDITYDCYATRSQDRGDSWATPVKVNPNPPGGSNQIHGGIVIDDSVDPARIYISYSDQIVLSNYDIVVATTTTDDWQNWTHHTIDDSATDSYQPGIYISPVDQSVNVAWSDPVNYGGTGNILFDRSTDNGATWGTDVVVFTHSGTTPSGPYESTLVIQPQTGIPGILSRYNDSAVPSYIHGFFKANDIQGSSWAAPVELSENPTGLAWAGALECTADGHWFVVLKEAFPSYQMQFTESYDDGVTWESFTKVDDAVGFYSYNPQMALDRCGTVHIVWTDRRTGSYQIMYDSGS